MPCAAARRRSWTFLAALAGGRSAQRPSISSSALTVRLARSASIASTPRCLPSLSGSDRPSTSASTRPRTRISIANLCLSETTVHPPPSGRSTGSTAGGADQIVGAHPRRSSPRPPAERPRSRAGSRRAGEGEPRRAQGLRSGRRDLLAHRAVAALALPSTRHGCERRERTRGDPAQWRQRRALEAGIRMGRGWAAHPVPPVSSPAGSSACPASGRHPRRARHPEHRPSGSGCPGTRVRRWCL